MSKNLQTTALALPIASIGSLESYIARVNQIPMLTEAEESELARRFYQDGDLEAARQLVMSHLRFVVKIARGYTGYGLPIADLIQEGNIGLMKAVKRFNPEVGVRLVSFAVHWIRAEIHEYVIRNWRIVKIATTKAQRKLFFNLRKAAKRLGWFSNDEIDAVANDLNVSTKEVRNMEARLNAHDQAFDCYNDDDSDGDGSNGRFAPALYLEDHSGNPAHLLEANDWDNKRNEELVEAMEKLDNRSQDILQQRWLVDDGNKATLHDLAAKYKISAERIRQLEKNALNKLKQYLEAA